MPTDKDFKRLVRARMGKTGEAYTTARANLRPDPDPGPAARLRARNPDTAALTRLLAPLGVTDPASGRPLGEATALGIAGGIGFAYFVFEYEQLTTLYLGGRVNSYVQRRDATEAALARLGVGFQTRKTKGAATAERQLRAALDQGRPGIVTVDAARFGDRSIPDWLSGMLPQDVLVEPGDGGDPRVWDLAPAPVPVTWAELAEARAGIAVTWRGMLEPPMRNFGVPGLAKWADLLTAPRDPKGWPRLLEPPDRQVQLLTWLDDWVETGTGGGFFRTMYAEFLEEAAGLLEQPELARLAGDYRELAAAWSALAGLARDAAGSGPLDPAALGALLAGLRERVLELAGVEEAAAAGLRAAVADFPGTPTDKEQR
jgi:hypothetical protein